MGHYDVSAVSARLQADKNLKTLFDISRGYGDEIAARWLEGETERTMTYTELSERVDDCAACLYSQVPDGGWIGLCLDTCPQWPVLFWAILRSGHNALLLDATAPDTVIQSLLEEAGCGVILCKKPKALSPRVRQIMVDTVYEAPRAENYEPVWGTHAAMCTSGTTGHSRIFVYSGEALCEQALSSELVKSLNTRVIADENRRALAFLPYHHVLGFMAHVIWCSLVGFTNLYVADRTPATLLKTCQTLKPQLLIVVPLLGNSLVRALDKKLSKESSRKRAAFKVLCSLSRGLQRIAPDAGLRFAEKTLFASVNNQLLGTEVECIILGGGHTPVETLKVLNALGYSTVTGYGMTETAITGFETELSLRRRLSGSVGKPLQNVEYRVVGEDGVPVFGSGVRHGELQIRGPGIHTGRLVGGKIEPAELLGGGWYPTGDAVKVDATGRLYIRGRLKDVIVNESGENIYPDDLEDVFSGLEGVDQVCVMGLVRETGTGNSNEDVALVLNVGENYRNSGFLQSLTETLAERNRLLPLSQQVTRVLVSPEALPVASGIKVKRLELKRKLSEKALTCRELDLRAGSVSAELKAPEERKEASAPTARHAEIKKKVRFFYAEALDIPEKDISDTAHFINDLQGDSLQVLSMVLKAEDEWGITLPVEEYSRCATVNDMTRVVEEILTGADQSAQRKKHLPVPPITRFEDTPEYLEFLARQQALLAAGTDNPYFVTHESPLLDTGIIDGKRVLEFGSYNYAGMSGRKEVTEAAKAAMDFYGTSASGSRLLAGEKQIHKDLERELADWKHAEDAIVCVGGHSTNVTFVGNFCGKDDLILYDALAHNSIEQGCKLSDATARPFPHNDVAALEGILKSHRSFYRKVLIVIEGAYSMDGDIAPVPDFVRVKKEYGCFLMVDEAHSSCVLGPTGGGVDEYFNLAGDDIDIKYGTLSKGLGTCGGYLAGKRSLIEYLRYNMPGFVFSVGISPGLAAGSLEAIRQLRSHPEIMENLHTAIRAFTESAKRRRLDICLAGETAVLPVMVGRDEDAWLLSNELKKRGVSVPPAMYPAVPKGKARLRFCVISEHKPEEIEEALDILESTAAELGIELPRRDYE